MLAVALVIPALVAPPTTPLRVEAPAYDKATGKWTLDLPVGSAIVGSNCGANGEAHPPFPPLPNGELVELATQYAGGEGGRVWRAAGALCRWQLGSADAIRGASVLELGAGTGISGLFAAGLGASRVLFTDGAEELVPLLEKNADRNRGRHLHGPSTVIQAARWKFGEAPPACVASEDGFDLVLASDITYSVNEDRDGLCATLQHLLTTGGARKCVIAHEHRRSDMFDVDAIVRNAPVDSWDENDVCLGTFLESADEYGLVTTQLVFERGERTEVAPGVVEMTTDLSVFEVQAVAVA